MAHPTLDELLAAVERFLGELPRTVQAEPVDEDCDSSNPDCASTTVEYRGLLIPKIVTDLYGYDLWERCKVLANKYRCDLTESNEGGLSFRLAG